MPVMAKGLNSTQVTYLSISEALMVTVVSLDLIGGAQAK